jgi:hypothetical protein
MCQILLPINRFPLTSYAYATVGMYVVPFPAEAARTDDDSIVPTVVGQPAEVTACAEAAMLHGKFTAPIRIRRAPRTRMLPNDELERPGAAVQ